MKEKVKINDIARESGVSVATVSLALNNKPGVSEETRARIFETAEALGYPIKPPNPPGRCTPFETVGMVIKSDPDIPPQANPFYSKVIVGIEDACRRSGINLLFATLPVDENNCPVDVPPLLYNDSVDGLLMVGAFVDETFAAISGKNPAPLVLVDGYSNTESYDAVISDNFHAAYQAVEYLLQKGHRHIGLLGADSNAYPSLRDRRNGYLRALKEHEIPSTYTADFNLLNSHGYEEASALLKTHPQITALFCINDDVGVNAIKAVQDLGKHVPEDVSVIGFDDTYLAANAHPPLTTLRVDTLAMGRAAVHLLSLRAENPESARMTITVHPSLVERDSVQAAPTPA